MTRNLGDAVLRFGWTTLALIAVLTTPVAAQKKPASRAPKKVVVPKSSSRAATPVAPPTVDSLNAITRRGHELMSRDSVAWLGGDAMEALSFPQDGIRRLITRRAQQGWEVARGKLTENGSTFLIDQIAMPGIQEGLWATSQYDPPMPDSGYVARAARAIETSISMFHRLDDRPYIAMAIPADDDPWWFVYLYPARVKDDVWPRGGDMRFRVSADGRVITESRHLHETITEYSVRSARSASAGTDKKSLVSGETPEDTDVFHVLQRRPALPELMTAGKYRYRIDVDGSIRMLP
jgi:hypothetical protein